MVPLSVLVIDDNSDHCELHRQMLELDGHRVRTSTDCKHGLDLLRQNDFHVVLLDLLMPQVEGLELLPRIRDIDSDVAIVIVTGHPSIETAAASMAHEVTAYVPKPVTIEAFRDIAARVIRKKGLDPQGEDILHKVIGHNIRTLRREADLTLKQLARRTGLSSSLLSQMERAGSQSTVSSLFKLAAALGVNLVELLAGYEGPGRTPARGDQPEGNGPGSDREARSAAVSDREARSAAVSDREARSAAVSDREARSAAVSDPRDE